MFVEVFQLDRIQSRAAVREGVQLKLQARQVLTSLKRKDNRHCRRSQKGS
jgi:hypothetical protein